MPRNALPARFRAARLIVPAATLAVAAALAVPSAGPRGEVLTAISAGAIDGTAANGGEPPATPATTLSPNAMVRPRDLRPGPVPDRARAETAGPSAPPVEALEGYVWPLPNGRLTLPFGPTPWGTRVVDRERFHDGIDLATFCGDRVVAAHDGRVLAAGRRYDAFMGWVGDLSPYLARLTAKGLWSSLPIVVVVDDGNGYRSVYAHFGRVVVKPGQRVTAGQLLGYEGMTGHASGCHLHFGLFSPWEATTMAIRPDVVERMLVPPREIARVDPLPLLPPRPGINAPATPEPRGLGPAPAPSAVPRRP